MATRTTAGAVVGILNRDYNGTTNLSPFILAASILVDNLVTAAANISITIDSTTLTEIERWLAAHAYCQSDRIYQERQMGSGMTQARGVYAIKTDKGLDSTPYGQMAKLLDPSGLLSEISKEQINAGMTWLGLRPSQQTPYYNRW